VFSDVREIQRTVDLAVHEVQQCFLATTNFSLSHAHTSSCHPPLHLVHLGTNNRQLKVALSAGFTKDIPRIELNPLSKPRKRIGFVVTRGHEGIFLRGMASFLRQLDRDRLERRIFCYPASTPLMVKETDSRAEECISIAGPVPTIATAIAAERCDVLYYWEVGTDATNFFLAQHRLTPRQCTSFGVQDTSGAGAIDDYLSSTLLDGEVDRPLFSERLVLLPAIPAFIERPSQLIDRQLMQRLGMPDGKNLYVCNQNPLKIHPRMDAAFAEILRRDPKGLLLITSGLASGVKRRIHARFQKSFPTEASRVHWLPWMTDADFNSLTACAHVVLDTFPMAAGTSAYTTLGLGTPIVTIHGNANRGRMTSACLRSIRLPESIANSVSEYVDKAVSIGMNPEYRDYLRGRITQQSSVLFDFKAAAASLEDYFAN
jgi:predicted O-linked N-acetylglucosamine transferase (SPINDLY family)